MSDVRFILDDCLDVLPTLEAASVDCIITDPPYPCIKRSYGYWTEAEWFEMMRIVVPECMRILKPTGSAVFILQPNSERLGRMRTWLWEFIVWVGKEWGIVQDTYWLNQNALPEAHSIQGKLLRPSLKTCVWVGSSSCWRDQDAVLAPISPRQASRIRQHTKVESSGRKTYPSGQGCDAAKAAKSTERLGGTKPFNVICCNHGAGQKSAGALGHPAGTPLVVVDWWLRYICPPGGTVLDPFSGSGTVVLAADKQGKRAIGIERVPAYHAIAEKRIAEARAEHPLFTGPTP